MSEQPVIFWFRNDLRLADNAGLAAARAAGRPLVLVYILDQASDGVRPLGGAQKWWLDKSLRALSADIASRGGSLVLRQGAAAGVLSGLVKETGAQAVLWNRRYGPARHADAAIKSDLRGRGLTVESFNASYLMEPFELKTGSGDGYKVFTPYWRALQAAYEPSRAHPSPRKLDTVDRLQTDDIDSWKLHPSRPDWSGGMAEEWTPGEAGAAARLSEFLDLPPGYAEARDRPDQEATSRLSPHLQFGEIGPAQIWRSVRAAEDAGQIDARDAQKFLSELAWREFSAHLLYHDPDMIRLSWRRQFDVLPWRKPSKKELAAWKRGRTGYPIVDAGMRQLWTTGWMHNRVRMIVASFLTKDLLIHWRDGEEWFWDTLVDADEANNANGWQWTAGSGADASPYFRVFNPVLQGEKFDPDGAYVRRWVPELTKMPDKFIHRPWEADAAVLAAAGVTLGQTYAAPMIDHGWARKRALAAYASIKSDARQDATA